MMTCTDLARTRTRRIMGMTLVWTLCALPVWAQSAMTAQPTPQNPLAAALTVAEMDSPDESPPSTPPSPSLTTRTPVLYPERGPTRVQVAILSGAQSQRVANTLAVLIGDLRRKSLETRIGLKVEVVNISRLDTPPRGRNIIYYRPPFLRAALLLAETVPGDQTVQPMGAEMLKRSGIDVEVWVAE